MQIAVCFCCLDLSSDDLLTWLSATTIFLPGSQQRRSSYLDLCNDDPPGLLVDPLIVPVGIQVLQLMRQPASRNKTFLKSQESEIFPQSDKSGFGTRGPGCGLANLRCQWMSVDYCSVSVTLVVDFALVSKLCTNSYENQPRYLVVSRNMRDFCRWYQYCNNPRNHGKILGIQLYNTRGYIMRYPGVWVKCVQNYGIRNTKSSQTNVPVLKMHVWLDTN